jgi:aryl-alcohol dehydrogenase-like predicted oxidoreductase
MKANALARELGTARFDCLQPQYSLVCRFIEREHLPLCIEEGIGVIPWSPLGGGLLTGKIRKGEPLPEGSRASVDEMNRDRFRSEKNLEIADVVSEVGRMLGRTPSQVALAWVIRQAGVTSAIFGARTLEQLDDNLGAADLALDEESLRRLEEVSQLDLVYPYDFHARVRAMMGEQNLER